VYHDKFFSLNQISYYCVCDEEELTAHANGKQWRKHKTDGDRWPSDPHAITLDGRFKLDLTNGDVYSVATGKYVEKLHSRHFRQVRVQLRLLPI
jgi:hypothetical protein